MADGIDDGFYVLPGWRCTTLPLMRLNHYFLNGYEIHRPHVNPHTAQYNPPEPDYRHWYGYPYQSPDNQVENVLEQHAIVLPLNLLKLS